MIKKSTLINSSGKKSAVSRHDNASSYRFLLLYSPWLSQNNIRELEEYDSGNPPPYQFSHRLVVVLMRGVLCRGCVAGSGGGEGRGGAFMCILT